MAAYEILLLNTAIPQIQAAQSGDTYVVPRDISFSAKALIGYTDYTGVGTNGLAVAGNVGIGTSSPGARLSVITASANSTAATIGGIEYGGSKRGLTIKTYQSNGGDDCGVEFNAANGLANYGSFKFVANTTTFATIDYDGTFRVKGAGTAGSTDAVQFSGSAPAESLILDSSGNLGIGTSSPSTKLSLGGGIGQKLSVYDLAGVRSGFGVDMGGSSYELSIFTGYNGGNGTITFGGLNTATNTYTERARITSGGYFKASNSGTYNGSTASYHELYSNASGDWIGYFTQATASNPNGVLIQYTAAAPNGTGNTFLYCQDNAAVRATIRSNGGLANYQSNNVDLSDARTKTDINPLGSYWNKIAGLEIVTYKYKDQTHDDLNIGVIAQQVEAVAPEFVDVDGFGETPEDGVPLKTIYNKDLTFAAIKALQEAMSRIETLEAEVAALKGN